MVVCSQTLNRILRVAAEGSLLVVELVLSVVGVESSVALEPVVESGVVVPDPVELVVLEEEEVVSVEFLPVSPVGLAELPPPLVVLVGVPGSVVVPEDPPPVVVLEPPSTLEVSTVTQLASAGLA